MDVTTRLQIAARCADFTRDMTKRAAVELKRAAVAIAITMGENSTTPTFLLTRRAESLRSHGGQWALPGGRCDTGETAIQAALRELHEELGIALNEDCVLAVLDDYPTRSGYLVSPVVVWVNDPQIIMPNSFEVASVHQISLEVLGRADSFDFVSIPESTRPLVRFHYEESVIYAPTAAMIYQFREVLAGRTTRVSNLEQPVFAWK